MEEAIVALLSGVAGGRRFWTRAPQNITATDGAYIVLNRVDGGRDYSMAGASGYVASRVQVDVYAETYTAAKTAARAAVAALSAFRGTQSGVAIQGIFIDSERDLPAADEVSHLFRTSIDVIVHHD